jgi:trehalose 6-phosphate phosphatase
MPIGQARWAVMLDADRLLLPVADDMKPGAVPADVSQLLGGLHRVLNGALALISGRELDDIDNLFGRMPWAVAASQGLELRHADGSFRRRDVASDSQARMREIVTELASRLEGVRLEETKRTATLHCDKDVRCLLALRNASKALPAQLPDYELRVGRDSVQFRPHGMDRGLAVRELLRHPAFAGCMPVYLGAELADEHAFKRVNRAHGNSIRVGNREPTLANYSLPDPAAARIWLGEVLEALSDINPRQARPLVRTSGVAR